MTRLGGWIRSRTGRAAFLTTALACALMVSPSHAASVLFNPTGGGFASGQSANIFSTNQFGYDAGSALAVGAVQALNNFAAGSGATTFQVYFQNTLATVAGSPNSAGNSLSINSDLPVPPTLGVNGDIKLTGSSPVDTGKMITLVGTFTEQVTGLGTVGNTLAATFGLASTQVTNNVTLYAIPAGTANESTGSGFVGTPAQAILTGTVTTGSLGFNFSSSFGSVPTGTTSGSQSNPVPFDQYSQQAPNPPYTSPWTGTTNGTVQGNGSVNLPVLVTSVNANWFQTNPGILSLNFPGFGTNLPFGTSQPPATSVDGQVALGTLGSVNGALGPGTGGAGDTNIEFLTQGVNGFQIPEPSSLLMATISIGFVSAVCLRSRRRRS
jgi:hypothetical protein